MKTTIIETYNNNGYPAHNGVSIKTITDTAARSPEDREKTYAIGLDISDWFLCRFDSHGNICDANGIVVFPSMSGRHPAQRGDLGYFGDFRENFPEKAEYQHLPSVNDDVYRRPTADDTDS